MKIGNRVIVNSENYTFEPFFDAVGTIIGEFINQVGVRKLVVHFDHPVVFDGLYDPIYKDFDTIFEIYDFEECYLDIMEK